MILSIIGIVIGLVAIGLFIWLKNEQEMTTDLTDSDVRSMENCYKALMEDFTNYQVDSERKRIEMENQLEIKDKNNNQRMDRMQKDLPSIIGRVVGQIEFAQDTINRK